MRLAQAWPRMRTRTRAEMKCGFGSGRSIFVDRIEADSEAALVFLGPVEREKHRSLWLCQSLCHDAMAPKRQEGEAVSKILDLAKPQYHEL